MNLSLHEKALQAAKAYKKSEVELLNILELIDKDKMYLAYGVSSLFRYCVELLALSESDSYRFMQVSRKAQAVPELKQALQSQELSVSKASRIASVINQDNQSFWIEKAKSSTHRELEREVARIKPKEVGEERVKILTPDISELKLNISKDLEEKLRRAQEVLKANTLEETLKAMVELTLKAKDPIQKAERVMTKKTKPPTWKVAKKEESKRTIPAFLIHQVNLRDKGRCRFKNCGETRSTEIHHKVLRSCGGTNRLDNLITLCSSHHSMLHQFSKSNFAQVKHN